MNSVGSIHELPRVGRDMRCSGSSNYVDVAERHRNSFTITSGWRPQVVLVEAQRCGLASRATQECVKRRTTSIRTVRKSTTYVRVRSASSSQDGYVNI